MPRRRAVLACALGAIAVAAGAAAPATPAAAKCPATKASATLNGARSCAPLARVRPTAAPPTRAAGVAAFALGYPIPLRQKGGGVVTGAATPRRSAKAIRTFADAEAVVDAAIVAARAKKQAEKREHGGTTTSLSTNGDGSMTGRLSQSAGTGDGGTVTVNLGITARKGSDDDPASFDLDLSATVVAKDGSQLLGGIRARNITGSKIPDCPTATGALPLKSRIGVTTTSGETFGSKRVNLGGVRQGTAVDLSVKADASLGPDARLKPFPVTATASLDYSRSATVLALFGSRSRAVGSTTLTGIVDPVTGQISGASITTKVRAGGFVGATDAEAADSFRPVLEKLARDDVGRALKWLKEAETNARTGKCTRLAFVPASPATLATNASTSVQAQLFTVEGNTAVPSARWAAVPVKGGVSPTSLAGGSAFDMTVRGAATGPETARINVKAVSPAGISEGTWIATPGMPPSYTGTVSTVNDLGSYTESWNGTFTWTKESEQTNPDGSKLGLYTLTSASLAQFARSGGCVGGIGAPGGTLVSGDIEIQVSPAGDWTSAFLVDVSVPPFQMTCGMQQANVTNAVAIYNSRAGLALRPMTPAGPITGAGITDGVTATLSTVADWSLTPGS